MGPARSSSFKIGAKARGEHQQHHTDLSKDGDGSRWCCTRLSRQGPMSRPAMISPTTCGALHLRATSPKNLALIIMMARFRKTEYMDLTFFHTLLLRQGSPAARAVEHHSFPALPFRWYYNAFVC